MAAVIVADKGAEANSPLPLWLVMIAIPVMCVMLDAHLLEKALQARIISHFIIKEFEDKNLSSPWFKTFWSIGGTNSAAQPIAYLYRFLFPANSQPTIGGIVGARSATTSIISIVPTVLVFYLAAWYAFSPIYRTASMATATVFATLYFASSSLIFSTLRAKLVEEK